VRDEVARAGFTIVSGVLPGSEMETLVAALAGATRSKAGARHLMTNADVARVAHDPRVLALATHVLGVAAIPYRATLFDKSPGTNWLVSWHQDTALPVRERCETSGWGPWSTKAGVLHASAPARVLEQIVALRIHLDDSTAQNGPLRVIPGSHRVGVLTADAISQAVARDGVRECPVPRGGILVMRPLLIHASSKAITAAPRRVLHLEYACSIDLEAGLRLRIA
jgi:ectoine hydroxylase-related dioxygenase (phytanoyl-CoA dioxygenase family)